MASLSPTAPHPSQNSEPDIDTLLETLENESENDPTQNALREQRLQELHNSLSLARDLRRDHNHGTYIEIKDEKEMLEITTNTAWCVVHFMKPEFGRCGVMDAKLEALAPRHITTRFLRINVENAPFLVTKLNIKVLPCVLAFVDGVSVDRIIGFEGLGYTEHTFTVRDLEARLLKAGVLERLQVSGLEEEEGDGGAQRRSKKVAQDEDDDDDWD